MSEHKKPAPGSGYERLPNPPIPPPQGTLDHAWYGLMSGWKAVVVGSSLEDHGAGKLVHHISISKSLLGERMKAGNFPADVQHALEAFAMQGAEEDNSASAGYAHHFWMLANPQGVN